MSLSRCLLLGAALRIALLAYGAFQDRTPLKYTDIDYFVFTDAARFVVDGESPYRRETYRYTPLLAWMLVPNVVFSQFWGKLLFSAFDLGAGWLVARFLQLRGMDKSRATWRYASLIILNPFIAAISTRGSAESVVNFLVIATFALLLEKRPVAAAISFGLAVHFKIYPILYALPILVVLDGNYSALMGSPAASRRFRKDFSTRWNPLSLINRERIVFALISGGTFVALNALMFAIYGNAFLDESLLYHIGRKDHRHNFSVYFYSIYLDYDRISSGLAMVPFALQLLLAFVLGLKFGRDPAFAALLQTISFVALNKVSTSQYFVWYLAILPLALPSINLSRNLKRGSVVLGAWIATQALWLWRAYRLEFLGENTFRSIWAAGLLFFWAHIGLLVFLLRCGKPQPWFDSKQIVRAYS